MRYHQHEFSPCDKEDYELCACGTYHSTKLWPREILYSKNYWSQEEGHSTFDEQIWNVAIDTVNEFSKVNKIISTS